MELVPQGTLAERIRAHAAGIPAFFTPTGASTAYQFGEIPVRYNEGGIENGVKIEGVKKEGREWDGREYVLEHAIAGDVAFVRAWKVDEVGNCVFRFVVSLLILLLFTYRFYDARYTSQNFSTVMAKNAKLTIVEVTSTLAPFFRYYQ